MACTPVGIGWRTDRPPFAELASAKRREASSPLIVIPLFVLAELRGEAVIRLGAHQAGPQGLQQVVVGAGRGGAAARRPADAQTQPVHAAVLLRDVQLGVT